MVYKILINSKAQPVLIEVPEKPRFNEPTAIASRVKLLTDYQDAIASAISDESKHIRFKDVDYAERLLRRTLEFWDIEYRVGTAHELPEGYEVSFDDFCDGDGKKCKEELCYYCPFHIRTLAILTPIERPAKNCVHSYVLNIEGHFECEWCGEPKVAEASENSEKDGWISVKEIVPHERTKAVLVFNGDAPIYNQCVSQATWYSQSNSFIREDKSDIYLGTITHWMPLPKPPKILKEKED